MDRKSSLGVVLALSLIMSACSSSPTQEGDDLAFDDIPELEAETDAVPMDGVEQASSDGGVLADDGFGDAALAEGEPEPFDAPAEGASGAAMADSGFGSEASFGEGDPFATDGGAGADAGLGGDAALAGAGMGDAALDPLSSSDAGAVPTPVPVPEASMSVADSGVVPIDSMGGSVSGGGTGEFQTYTVNSGDTLMKIAFETYGDLYRWKKIYEDNRDKISDPNRLERGVQLRLEAPANPVAIDRNGEQYLIQPGDTLGSISKQVYGTTSKWRRIWENNRQLIKDPNRIFAGFYLYYVVTPEDQQEMQRYQEMQAPPPLAEAPVSPVRDPASDQWNAAAPAAASADPGAMAAPPMGGPGASVSGAGAPVAMPPGG